MKKKERVIIYIDGSNLYHGIKNEIGRGKHIPVDFERFAEILCGKDRLLIRICYYTAPLKQLEDPKAYAGQQKFFNQLRKITNLTLRLGRLVRRERETRCPNPKCGKVFIEEYKNEKGVDVFIATDMLADAFKNQYDIAILVSGDGDFIHVVEEIKRLGKKVENAYPFESKALVAHCTRFTLINKSLIKPCRISKKKS